MRKSVLLFFCFLTAVSLMAQKPDILKVSILGDSYSTFEGYLTPDTNAVWFYRPENEKHCKENDVQKVEQTWWYQVIQKLKAKLEVNNSYSGATICYSGYKYNDLPHADYSDRAFITRSNSLGDPDLILVCGATNDSWADAPIGKYLYGNPSKQDLYSFRPAFAKLLADLKQNYPAARLVFMLNTELKPEINESVHRICHHYQVSCLDLKDIDKQVGHPSVKGMKSIADQVLEFLKK